MFHLAACCCGTHVEPEPDCVGDVYCSDLIQLPNAYKITRPTTLTNVDTPPLTNCCSEYQSDNEYGELLVASEYVGGRLPFFTPDPLGQPEPLCSHQAVQGWTTYEHPTTGSISLVCSSVTREVSSSENACFDHDHYPARWRIAWEFNGDDTQCKANLKAWKIIDDGGEVWQLAMATYETGWMAVGDLTATTLNFSLVSSDATQCTGWDSSLTATPASLGIRARIASLNNPQACGLCQDFTTDVIVVNVDLTNVSFKVCLTKTLDEDTGNYVWGPGFATVEHPTCGTESVQLEIVCDEGEWVAVITSPSTEVTSFPISLFDAESGSAQGSFSGTIADFCGAGSEGVIGTTSDCASDDPVECCEEPCCGLNNESPVSVYNPSSGYSLTAISNTGGFPTFTIIDNADADCSIQIRLLISCVQSELDPDIHTLTVEAEAYRETSTDVFEWVSEGTIYSNADIDCEALPITFTQAFADACAGIPTVDIAIG